MRIQLKFHIYFTHNIRFKCFRFHVRHFDLRLNSHRIVHRAILLSAAVTCGILKNKRSNIEFVSEGDLRPLILWSPSLSHFHQKIIHPTFTSGDVILMALGIRRSAMINSGGQLDILTYLQPSFSFPSPLRRSVLLTRSVLYGCISALGHRISSNTDDPRQKMFLFHRISVAIQLFKAYANSFDELEVWHIAYQNRPIARDFFHS